MNRLPRHLAALTGLALSAAALAACGTDETEPTAADPVDPTPSSDAPASTDTPSAEQSGDPTPPPEADGTVVPVYFVGDGASGPCLFREFRQVAGDNPLEEAAALLVAGDALDPDYRTLLPDLDITRIEQDEAAGTIDVFVGEDSSLSDKTTSPDDSVLAVQSLVYTLQGVAQTRDPVRVVGPDGTPLTIMGVPTDGGVRAEPQLDVLSLVNVTAPEEGQTVSGTFTAEGRSSSFEATTPWEIQDADGKVVLTGSAMARGWIDRLYPWTTDIDVSSLAPGDYTFVARTDDPTGGTEGPGPSEDTKAITVE